MARPSALKPETKRKVYFAFRYRDIMRVNNVRNAWRIDHPSSPTNRSFYDRSIWDGSNAKTVEGLKDVMRRGVEFSSAVCVLVGTDTWWSRWVRYEIARSVVDEKGLLAVHIKGLNHVATQAPCAHGSNPLHYIGVYGSPDGGYHLYEKVPDFDPQPGSLPWRWVPYEDFKSAVPLPRYIPYVQTGYVQPLSGYVREYDYAAESGHTNIGAWIDQAALVVGR
jgi:antiphage defense system Thoeris ThsB-like protein